LSMKKNGVIARNFIPNDPFHEIPMREEESDFFYLFIHPPL